MSYLMLAKVAIDKYTEKNADYVVLDNEMASRFMETIRHFESLNRDCEVYDFDIDITPEMELVVSFEIDYFTMNIKSESAKSVFCNSKMFKITSGEDEISTVTIVYPGVWKKIKRS